MKFKLKSKYKPKGSQPEAIKSLVAGIKKGYNTQTLLGVTGSGKTFSMANIISQVGKKAIVLAHNKTLAAQLYNEFKELFPENRVEYFVSYYDYYQPESYIPARDQYIEKDSQINPKIEQLRLGATASLLSREDVIVVASVSAIYSVGNPEYFQKMGLEITQGLKITRSEIISRLVELQFERNDTELMPGRFRVKGETVDFIPGYQDDIIRIELNGDSVERIIEIEKVSGKGIDEMKYFYVYPAKHFVMPEDKILDAIAEIKSDMEREVKKLGLVEAHRLKQRTLYDIEMLKETGSCKGIENYSRYFDGRKKGERPYCLLDYFGDDFLIFIDESHQTIPQLNGMYKGDFARKKNLIDYGFRLSSAFDNRPLKFIETEKFLLSKKTVFVSATPGIYEKENSKQIVEQIIRPTGLIDPVVEVVPIKGQMDHLKENLIATIKKGHRALVTTITKKLAEELTDYLAGCGIKTRYLHSEIDTLERTEIIRQLRAHNFDVLVGINLLREGIDIPEIGYIGILDADKEGFLRDTKSLIQIIGRAARNTHSKVVMYADNITKSIKQALLETERRRKIQTAYNKKNKITPRTIIKAIPDKKIELKDIKHIPKKEYPKLIKQLEKEMKEAADRLDFEAAIAFRDRLNELDKS